MHKKTLICIVGPTAVGKTSLSIELAKWLNTEIISADSRQFYKELEIGTAKPTALELATVPHHFINNLKIDQAYDVGQYEKEALLCLYELFKKHNQVLMVGGSGLFVNAVCNGLDVFPEIDQSIRDGLNKELSEFGLARLQNELKTKDPTYFDQVDLANPQRVIRALEVIRATGQAFSSFRKGIKKRRPFDIIKIGLEMDRDTLYKRIDLRMDDMIQSGLFEEAEKYQEYKDLNALQTVGYKEIFGYLAKEYNKEEAIRLLKRNSRRYAKRQLTWFKKDVETQWFKPSELNEIKSLIIDRLEFSVPE